MRHIDDVKAVAAVNYTPPAGLPHSRSTAVTRTPTSVGLRRSLYVGIRFAFVSRIAVEDNGIGAFTQSSGFQVDRAGIGVMLRAG
ncbi:hypothetical protein H7K24_02095 [Mycobacterium fragae]|uniref:hypothetical protein n=1 Tax=Mycobacterium fragae TaxID=1260918 RepID=UPI00111BD82A|nr:hypothetical protein [Mycobacterium fragae]MCV7398941.1 hypothetical protein [Mycobacterium fragae]